MPNRNESTPEYRYGFNGMEKDDEVTNQEGTSYDFGARIYNPRVGRWLSGDPHEARYPSLSTYSAFADNPIIFNDPDGRDIIYFDINGNYKYTIKASGADVYKQESAVFGEVMNAEGAYAVAGKMTHITLDYDNPLILSYVKQNQSWHDYVANLEDNGVWANLNEVQRTNILDSYGADFNERRWENYGEGAFAMALWPLAIVGGEALVLAVVEAGPVAWTLAARYAPKITRSLRRGNWEKAQRQFNRWLKREQKRQGCFVAGTTVLMADGSYKAIEDVDVGDFVLSYNENSGELEEKEVLKIGKYENSDLVTIEFDKGLKNTNTTGHPYYVLNKGWCSTSPKSTFDLYGFEVDSLQVGDTCFYYDFASQGLEKTVVTKIEFVDSTIWTYNLDEVEGNNNFFANGVIVHNKGKWKDRRGKEFRGGKQKARDGYLKSKDKDFQRWFHRDYKDPGAPNASKEAIDEAFKTWEQLGSPKVK